MKLALLPLNVTDHPFLSSQLMDSKFSDTSRQYSILLKVIILSEPMGFIATVPIPSIFNEALTFDEVLEMSPNST